MKTQSLTLCLHMLCAFSLAACARSAYLEADGDGQVAPRPETPERPVPPPSRQALPELVRRLEIGPPRNYVNLTVYPLLLRGGFAHTGALTLDEAVARGVLDIQEKGEGVVPVLLVRNDAMQPVFLMAGEIILGGKQNRIVRDDVLLPSRSGLIEVPVYCGERNRWQGPLEGQFKSGEALSAPSLRGMAAGQASQDRIWGEIDRQLGGAKVSSETRSYHDLYSRPEIQRELDRCVEELRHFCGPQTVGCVVLSDSRILGCDLFSDPGLFARLWPEICRSYAVEVVCPAPYPHPQPRRGELYWRPRPRSANVRRLLDAVASAGYSAAGTPGMGERWVLSGAASGNDLEYAGAVVHAAAFPVMYEIQPLVR